MKISQAIIQNRNISKNTPELFEAVYKGHYIVVNDDHGHGIAKHMHLTRYEITVTNKNRRVVFSDVFDCHTRKDAIRKALKGANLI